MDKFIVLFKESRIKVISWGILFFSLLSFILSYLIMPEQWSWSGLFLNVAISLLQLFFAIVIVNLYLSGEEMKRKNAVALIAVEKPIDIFHSIIGQILSQRYNDNNLKYIYNHLLKGHFDELSEDIRNDISTTICNNIEDLSKRAKDCYDIIVEIANYGTFVFNPTCLSLCIDVKNCYDDFVNERINNPNNYNKLAKMLLVFFVTIVSLKMELTKGAKLNNKKLKANPHKE